MKRFGLLLLGVGLLSACATEPMGPVAPPPPPRYAPPLSPAPPFGPATLVGRFNPLEPGRAGWSCQGEAIVLLRATEPTVRRMALLYGSTVEAFAPVEVVRRKATAIGGSETAEPPVTTTTCEGGRGFRIAGLPRGGYFVIARARLKGASGADRGSYALMRRVELHAAEVAVVTFPDPQVAAPTRAPQRRPTTGARRPAPRP